MSRLEIMRERMPSHCNRQMSPRSHSSSCFARRRRSIRPRAEVIHDEAMTSDSVSSAQRRSSVAVDRKWYAVSEFEQVSPALLKGMQRTRKPKMAQVLCFKRDNEVHESFSRAITAFLMIESLRSIDCRTTCHSLFATSV